MKASETKDHVERRGYVRMYIAEKTNHYLSNDHCDELMELARSPVKDAAPAPVLTEEERKLVEDFKQAQRKYPNASFASKWHNGLLAIIDRLTKTAPQPEEKV